MDKPHLPCHPPRDARYTFGMRLIRRAAIIGGAVIVIFFILRGISIGCVAHEYFENRRETTGVIIEATSRVVGSPKGKHRTIFEIRVEFRDEDGVEHNFRSTVSYDQFRTSAVGSEIPVIYRIDHPDSVPRAFDDDDHRAAAKKAWTMPLSAIFLVAICCSVAGWQMHRERRLARTGQAIIGQVNKVTEKRGSKGGAQWLIDYSFHSPMIETRSGWARFLLKPDLEVGSPVAVLYDPLRRRRHQLVLDLKFVDPDSLHWPERPAPTL